MAMIRTPDTFVQEYMGKRIDDDEAYKEQCVDGFRVGCKYVDVPAVPTPNNWADGYWTCLNANGTPSASTERWQNTYFEKIRNPQDFRNGDWVIWARGSASHPSSHIAMYYNGQSFGENQGGDRAFCLKDTDFSDAYGALRPKAWTTHIPDYESELTTSNGHLYHLYGQADGLRAVVLSPGLNRTEHIRKLDCNADVLAKITGCNYFQMRDDIPDQPQGTTYGPISSPLCGVYQTLPNQDSTMFFDLETGQHADCTGVVINELHNVFSPALIYQPGKNVQYARMVGLSLCNHASTYCFVIRETNGRYVLGLSDQDLTPNQIAEDFMAHTDLESISFIDGGDSAQMMRYITKDKRVEYTRETERNTAGCIAFIGSVRPAEPTVPEPQEPEPVESEEEPMSEVKPVEQTEISPVDGWADPEQQTSIIKERIAALLSVKSILTLTLTVIFGYLVVNQIAIPDLFNEIYKIVILFFFGYQTGKAAGK